MRRSISRRWHQLLTALLLTSAGAIALGRLASGSVPPAVVAGAPAVLLLAAAVEVVRRAWTFARGDRRAANLRAMVTWLGVALVVGGGLANWALGLQASTVLTEGGTSPLFMQDQLQGFEAGPLADPSELDLALRLDRVRLAGADSAFDPVSELTLFRSHTELERMRIAPGKPGESGGLRFHAGAFGYAPRIVVLRDGQAVFDQVVPFLTRREGPDSVRFEGRLHIEAADLDLEGYVDLSSLDGRMRGHPRLLLAATRGGTELGRGELVPGRFAELTDGTRVGFAGLKKWSEVLIARRNYRQVMLVGFGLVAAGLLAWPFTRRRRR